MTCSLNLQKSYTESCSLYIFLYALCYCLHCLSGVMSQDIFYLCLFWFEGEIRLQPCLLALMLKPLSLDCFGVSCLVLEISAVEISAFSLI